MKQVNSFRYWLSAILLVFIGMTAQAQQQLTVGTSEHGTVTFTVGGATVTAANTGDNVNVVIAPAPKGWQVDKVTATAYTSWGVAEARSTMPTELPSVKVVAVSGQWQFTMPAYNVRVDVTYKKTSLEGLTIAPIPDQTYTGKAIEPALTVTDGDYTLVPGTDYVVKEWKDNVNVGTATVTIKGADGSGYEGEKSQTFRIVAKPIDHRTVEFTPGTIADQTYTGSQIKPSLTVKDNESGKTLVENTDYTLSYGENVNVGKGTVTVTGTGNYTGSKTVEFNIVKADPTVTQRPTGKPGLVYNEQNQPLLNGGTATGGTIQYSTDGGQTWKDEIPTGKDANENGYSVQWRVTGDGNHNNSQPQTISVPIARADISAVTLTPTAFTYDGSEKKPSEAVTATSKDNAGNAITLTVPAAGYDISGNKGTNAGAYTATVTGKGNFKGTKTAAWQINKANFSDASRFTATLAPTTYVYDGTAKTPAVTVKDGTKVLTLTTDYTVSYADNVNVGTGKVTVTGAGTNYEGTINLTFSITNLALTSVTVEPASLTYNGTEQTVTIKEVKAGSLTLTAADYEVVSGQKGTNVGEYTLTVKAKAGSNYAGQATTKWNITALSIANATVTLNPTTYTYDGTEKRPTATVTVGSLTLTAGTDFDVTYRDNVNAGTATATITGKGNYKDITSKTFTISQADLTSVTVKNSPLTYNGKQQTVLVDKVMAGSLTVPATDYEVVSGQKGTNVGEYTIQVSGKGNFKGTATAKWNIVRASITGAVVTLSPTEYTYDGTEKKPTATVKVTLDGTEYTLVNGTDYDVSYVNNVQAGTAKAVITGKGNYKDSAEKDFTINKSSGTVAVTPTTWTATYGDGAQTQQLTLTPTDLTTVQWLSGNTAVATVSNDGLVTVTGTGVTTIYALVLGDNNYFSSWAVCEVTVKPQKVSDVTVGAAGANGVPVLTAKNAAGETLSEGTDYEIQYVDANEQPKTVDEMRQHPGEYTAVVTFVGNYQGIVKKQVMVSAG